MSSTIFIDGGSPRGLPAASAVSSVDGIIVAQGGTPGSPGTATIREATIAQVIASASLLPTAGGTITGNLTVNGTTTLTGTPTGPTAAPGLSNGQLATTAFVAAALNNVALPTWINVKKYGAVCNNIADDTVALQTAISANYGGVIYIPGFCKITSALVITNGIRIEGAGRTMACFTLGTNNMVGISVTTAAPVIFSQFQMTPAGGVIGTTGIRIVPSSGINSESVFRDLQLIGLDKCIDTEAAAGWTCDNVDFLNFTTYGLLVQDIPAPDQGDSSVSNCYFQSSSFTQTSLQQNSSGGLKITNTKFLSGLNGYALELAAGASTGDLLITGCSFEGQAGASIVLAQAGAGSNFHSVEISGCQFNLTLQAISLTNAFATPGWITDVSITGGSMWINAAGTAINLDGVTGFSISGVDFHSLGAGVTCVNITSHSSNGMIAAMNYFGAGITNYVLNAGSLVTIQPKIQSGNNATATSVASGALFAGDSGAITFPRPYLGNTPKVLVTPNAVGGVGAVSAYAVSTGLTAFAVHVLGATNGATVTYDWVSYGDW